MEKDQKDILLEQMTKNFYEASQEIIQLKKRIDELEGQKAAAYKALYPTNERQPVLDSNKIPILPLTELSNIIVEKVSSFSLGGSGVNPRLKK